jgi:hypothetical protein
MAGRRKRAQPKTPRSQRGARASAVAKAVARDEGPYTRALKAVARVRGFSPREAADDVIVFLEALSDGQFDTSVPPSVLSGLPVGGL